MPARLTVPRRFPRIATENALLVRRMDGDEPEVLARTRTVSCGGCMFVHHETVGVGTALELFISLPGRVIKAEARVVWERVTASADVEVGVEFVRISPGDRRALDAALASYAIADA